MEYLHLISKMRDPKEGGSRIGIILNGSPLFTGDAGSGESEIHRYVLEYDLLEAIIALPTDMFYNTGIATYTAASPWNGRCNSASFRGTQHGGPRCWRVGSGRSWENRTNHRPRPSEDVLRS